MKFYRCWVGTKHPARNIPEGATDDTLLMFHCACMGCFEMAPPVIEARKRNPRLTNARVSLIAMDWHPPRNPVVRVGDLEDDDAPSKLHETPS